MSGQVRDRRTAYVAFGLVGVLTAAAIVFGVGVSSAVPKLSRVGAWLSGSDPGSIVHVNGLSGKVDARVAVGGGEGGGMKIVQDGDTVLIIDQKTGVVSRVDPAQLAVTGDRKDFSGFGAGLRIVLSGDGAYAVAPDKGTIQPIDPDTLESIGRAVHLKGPLGEPVADEKGLLWVPVHGDGTVVTVSGGRPGKPVKVAEPGEPFGLTLASGTPVVTNLAAATATVIGSSGPETTITLPSEVSEAEGDVLAPPTTEGPMVPVLSTETNDLVLIDTAAGRYATVKMRRNISDHELKTPQALGRKIYIPDETRGALVVYDAATGRFEPDINVTGKAGDLEVFVKDGLLWVNDPDGDEALVVDDEGNAHSIAKNDEVFADDAKDPKAPKDPARPKPRDGRNGDDPNPRPSDGPSGDPRPSDRPRPGPTQSEPPEPTPDPTPTPKPEPREPGPPTDVTARSGDGFAEVTFSPSQGGEKPERYVIRGGNGLEGTRSAGADGPYRFRLTGGDCGQEYSFTVVAEWSGGEVPSDRSGSVRTCTAPGSAKNVKAAAAGKGGVKVTWSPPANADGVTYTVGCRTPKGRDLPPKQGLTGTSHTFGNLWKNGTYACSVTTKNAAGTGQKATGSSGVNGPPYTAKTQHSENSPVKACPTPAGGKPQCKQAYYGNGQSVTVQCVIKGETYTHPKGYYTTNTYVRRSQGDYLVKFLISVPGGQEAMPPDTAPVWEC